jgi:3'(2'), 5'-bisphosphate nucleotidase
MKSVYEMAILAAVEAGEAVREIYDSGEFGIEIKADESPLTIADRRSNQIITEALRETGLPILSEEGRSVPYDERRLWPKFWLVDPLDGTKEFIEHNGDFTINIALVEDGRPVFGVVFAPVAGELYVGIQGRGAYLCREEKYFRQPLDYLVQFADTLPLETEQDDPGTKIGMKRKPDGEGIIRVVASRLHFNEDTRSYIESMEQEGGTITLVNRGSSLKLCMVASGEAEIYPRLGPTMEWDTAAAHAVAVAAGCRVSRIDNDEELLYNKENLLNPYFVVR